MVQHSALDRVHQGESAQVLVFGFREFDDVLLVYDEPQRNSEQASEEAAGRFAGGSGWVTTRAAAKALGVSRRSVQSYVHRGLLEARQEGEGVQKTFYVSIDSLNALRDRRRRERREAEASAEISSEAGARANADETVGEALRRIAERLEARTAEAADLRARLEFALRQSMLTSRAPAIRWSVGTVR